MRRAIAALVGLAALGWAPPTPLAVDGVPAGPEFRISPVGDTYTNTSDGAAWDPRAVPTSDGGFAVVWESYSYDYGYYYSSYGRGLRMRRFGPTGSTPKGGESKIFFDENGYGNFRPSLGIDAADQFIVVWSNFEAVGGEEKGRVWARRFNQAGNPLAARFEVTPDGGADANYQARNEVAVAPDNGFLVVWEDYTLAPGNTILARRYNAGAVAQTAPFQVNGDPLTTPGYPAVTADENGVFTVVWTDYGGGSVGPATTGRRLGPTGTPLAPEFPIFAHANDENPNHVAAAPGGNVMVLGWLAGTGLTGRVFDDSGAPVTGEFVVDPDGDYGNVQAGPDGNFLVAWQEGSYGDIFGRWFSPTGSPVGARFQVNEDNDFTISNPGLASPALAIDDAGDFVVAWANAYYEFPFDPQESDREGPGVWARRFTTCGNGLLGRTETCDDGNAAAEDGCSSRCRGEACFHCTGEPSVCTQAAGCTAVCIDGAGIEKPSLTFNRIGAPLGDESLSFRGKIVAPPLDPAEYDPSTEGARIAVNGANLIYDTGAIPPGLVGTGCSSKDGWKVGGNPITPTYTYKNVSGAFPPGCVAGSAGGLRALSLKDKLAKDGKLHFKVKVTNGSIPAVPPPPVTAAVILGPSPAAGLAGRCGLVQLENAIGTRFFP